MTRPQPPAVAERGADGRHKQLPFGVLLKELAGLYRWLPASEKHRLWGLIALAFVSAVAESLMIALLVPFLGFIAGVGSGAGNFLSDRLPGLIGGGDEGLFQVTAGLVAALILASAALRIALLWMKLSLVESAGHEIGAQIYSRALRQPYAQFVRRNTSEIISGVEKVRGLVQGVLAPAIDALTALVMGTIIAAALVALQPVVALSAAFVLGSFYLVVTRYSRGRLARISSLLSENFTLRVKMIQEGLGGIRDIKIGQTEQPMVEEYRAIDAQYRDAKMQASFIAKAPRLFVEAIVLTVLVVAAALLAARPGGAAALLPVIGAMAYGLRRLMPLWQQVYLVRSSFASYSGLLADIRELLAMPVEPRSAAAGRLPDLGNAVVFEKVSFVYPGADEPALQDMELRVPRGGRVGLMGASGAGKSTLVDLFAGLLAPTSGRILIDGVPLDRGLRADWQSRLAYVPQSIFLIDDTVAANIAFGTAGTPDEERVRQAAREAEIAAFVESLEDGYETRVGERGVRLSGGQLQRIGLARALYRRPSVLILDEATSALDELTEARIIGSIERLGRSLTILAIAHRSSTLKFCETIYRVQDGRIVDGGSAERVPATGSNSS